ncbi:MAG: caspase family protein [Bacteroidota bacterium]
MLDRKIYALLVGINNYPTGSGVTNLGGCLEDIERIPKVIGEYLGAAPGGMVYGAPNVRILQDAAATTTALIRTFRNHLSQAGPQDTVHFHFSGHGSRQLSAPEFGVFFSNGFDETLVCYNSRLPGQHDLADKELAVLLSELNAGHILVTLDCCHAGSGVRIGEHAPTVRTAPGKTAPRSLNSYLDGYYRDQWSRTGRVAIPESQHILLAACNRWQKAFEHPTGVGLFTRALTSVLKARTAPMSYLELFSSLRSLVFLKENDQTPQFENHGGASPLRGFLGQALPGKRTSPLTGIYAEGGKYYLPLGAIHGLPYPPKAEPFNLVKREPAADQVQLTVIGQAQFKSVGPERSEITWTMKPSETQLASLQVQLESFYQHRPKVGLRVSPQVRDQLLAIIPDRMPIEWTPPSEMTEFSLVEHSGSIELRTTGGDSLIQYAPDTNPVTLLNLLLVLEQVIFWNGFARLTPPRRSEVFPDLQVDLWLLKEGKSDFRFHPRDNQVEITASAPSLHPQIRIRNESGQAVHCALFYLSRHYGVRSLANEEIAPATSEVILWGSLEGDFLFLPHPQTASTEIFQVILSEVPVQSYLLERDDLVLGGPVGTDRDLGKQHLDLGKWSLRTFRVALVQKRKS